ncbi:MAG: hypothetical protein ABI422_03785 [Sphingomicrobium sp.]
MILRSIYPLIALLVGGLVTMPAAAESPSKKVRDPNEKVCEDVQMLGSRLAVKRFCATRAEWAEMRQRDRDVVDQTQRSPNGPCQTVNTHSGAAVC